MDESTLRKGSFAQIIPLGAAFSAL